MFITLYCSLFEDDDEEEHDDDDDSDDIDMEGLQEELEDDDEDGKTYRLLQVPFSRNIILIV